MQRYPLSDEYGRYAWRNLLRTGTNDRRADRPKLYYPIFVGDDDAIRIPSMEWEEQDSEYRVLERPRQDETVVWPVKEQEGALIEKNWERGWERVSQEADEYRVQRNGNGSGAQGISSACLLGKEFADPFAYRLSVVREGARRDVEVDLPETFNWLIGLRVESRRRLDGLLAVAGNDAGGRKCLVLWRNLDEIDGAALDTWFDNHRAGLPEALDVVYVNGDHTLNAMRRPGETWVAESTEPAFRKLMFEE